MREAHSVEISATDPRWLNERYRFDARARSRRIEARMLNSLPATGALRLLDVGSGLGANTRYYGERLARNQSWTLVEDSRALADACRPGLSRWGGSHGWPWRLAGRDLIIRAPGARISVRVIRGSMFDVGDKIDLSRIDLVTANAVLDLISRDDFAALAGALAGFGIPVLATLNYRSMRFEPEEEGDGEIIRLYERHMRRRQSRGRSMGPDCGLGAAGCLRRMGYRVFSGKSTWTIGAEDGSMLACLLGFIGRALSEPWECRPDTNRLNRWLDRKRAQVEGRKAWLAVVHSDIFAAPARH